MEYKFLPTNEENRLYSPIGVQGLFKKAVNDEGGNIQLVFDKKDEYKQLIELWYASPLAVGIYKKSGLKFFMYPSDSPDIHFIRINEKGEQEGFSLEIMTLFDYKQKTFDQNYKELATCVWNAKGKKDYGKTELLLVSRLVGQFNIDSFFDQVSQFKWNFIRIWFSIFNQTDKSWTIFEIYPYSDESKIEKLIVGLTELPY